MCFDPYEFEPSYGVRTLTNGTIQLIKESPEDNEYEVTDLDPDWGGCGSGDFNVCRTY